MSSRQLASACRVRWATTNVTNFGAPVQWALTLHPRRVPCVGARQQCLRCNAEDTPATRQRIASLAWRRDRPELQFLAVAQDGS